MKTTKWVIDPAHSEISFKVKHMMFSNVTGKFDNIESQIETNDESFENAKINFSALTESVNTGNTDRDKHLKSVDFFDTENFPKLNFTATSFNKSGDNKFSLLGNLTIRGVEKPITLDVAFEGAGKDPWGNTKAAFSLNGTLNRKDYGLNWNTLLEAGGVLVSDEVRINADLQFVKQA